MKGHLQIPRMLLLIITLRAATLFPMFSIVLRVSGTSPSPPPIPSSKPGPSPKGRFIISESDEKSVVKCIVLDCLLPMHCISVSLINDGGEGQ